MAVQNLFIDEGKKMGSEESLFDQVLWNGQDEPDKSLIQKVLNTLTTPFKKKSVVEYTPVDIGGTIKGDTQNYFHTLDANSGKLSKIYEVETGRAPFPFKPHWEGLLSVSDGGFIKIDDLNLITQLNETSHKHVHTVLKELSFHSIGVEFEFQRTSGENYRHFVLLPAPQNYSAFVGAEGIKDRQKKYQLGVKQLYLYYLKLNNNNYIVIRLEVSIVLMYHGNDFEPVGIIDAVKFFPQIKFGVQEVVFSDEELYPDSGESIFILPENTIHAIGLTLENIPSDVDINTCKVHNLKGRVKMTANNNSSHHLDIEPDGNGNNIDFNHFKSLRLLGIPIPSVVEKYFDTSILNSNLPGFYTDSNYAGKDGKSRFYPYNLPFFVPDPPTWATIFDYVKPNIMKEIEIQAVYGAQDKSVGNADKFKEERKVKYTYPPLSDYALTLVKKSRQGEYDNIHFHGYLGYYADNQLPVAHAPICGFCCFHLHWRWSKLNYKLNSNGVVRKLTGTGDPTRFNGWNDKGINDGSGFNLPLIPPNQSLKIAITNEGKVPFNKEFVVDPGANPITLDTDIKSVWYSVDILHDQTYPEVENRYVILEQGAGYAFRYSEEIEKVFRYVKNVILGFKPAIADMTDLVDILNLPNALDILSTADLFEINYRLMRMSNIGPYSSYEQVPQGDYQPNINNPSMKDL